MRVRISYDVLPGAKVWPKDHASRLAFGTRIILSLRQRLLISSSITLRGFQRIRHPPCPHIESAVQQPLITSSTEAS
jgi:hypothetical protein